MAKKKVADLLVDVLAEAGVRPPEALVIPGIVQEPFHEHAGPDAEESLTVGTSEKRSDPLHVNEHDLANGGRKENGIDHPEP